MIVRGSSFDLFVKWPTPFWMFAGILGLGAENFFSASYHIWIIVDIILSALFNNHQLLVTRKNLRRNLSWLKGEFMVVYITCTVFKEKFWRVQNSVGFNRVHLILSVQAVCTKRLPSSRREGLSWAWRLLAFWLGKNQSIITLRGKSAPKGNLTIPTGQRCVRTESLRVLIMWHK